MPLTQSTIKTLLMHLQWLYSIGVKVVRVIPLHTIAITVLSLASQITLLLAFLLPIKVVILLGSESVPRYFPEFLSQTSRDWLIVGLTATSICCYLIHLLSDRWTGWLGKRGTRRLLERSGKFELFDNQTTIARRAYSQYASALAAAVFLCAGLLLLAVIYPLVALIVAGCCLLATVAGLARHHYDARFRELGTTKVPAHFKTAADLTFLTVFLLIVADYLTGNPPSILIGLIALILVRQLTTRIQSLVAHGVALTSRRIEVSALFFRAQTAKGVEGEIPPPLWQVIFKQSQDGHFRSALEAIGVAHTGAIDLRWQQTGYAGIGSYRMQVTASAEEDQSRQLLLKLYAKQRETYSTAEATLLTSINSTRLPAPQLLGVTTLDGLPCHLFDAPALQPIPQPERLQALLRFRTHLTAVELESEFIDKYQRSHPSIWQRLTILIPDRLELAITAREQRPLIDRFRDKLPQLLEQLQHLPPALVNAEATRMNLLTDASGETISIHWGRWSVEPAGCSWPTLPGELQLIDEYYPQLVKLRPALARSSPAQLKLAALTWEFERLFQRNLLTDCIERIEVLLTILEQCNVPSMEYAANEG